MFAPVSFENLSLAKGGKALLEAFKLNLQLALVFSRSLDFSGWAERGPMPRQTKKQHGSSARQGM